MSEVETAAVETAAPAAKAPTTAATLVKDLVDAGIHYGHKSTHWNPKMRPYIFGKRNKIHIIDVKETVKGILLAKKFLQKIASEGKDVLFVGTKRQAASIIEANAKACDMHYVVDRWLGGTLTNFSTIRLRLKRLADLEKIVETGEITKYSKKMEAQINREKKKITRNLGGIRNMNKMPGAMFIVDVSYESNAAKEAKKLGIPVIALIDTDANPDMVDLPIPGNDDAIRAIEIVVSQLAEAINEGKKNRKVAEPKAKAEAVDAGGDSKGAPERRDDKGAPRRRSSRTQFTA